VDEDAEATPRPRKRRRVAFSPAVAPEDEDQLVEKAMCLRCSKHLATEKPVCTWAHRFAGKCDPCRAKGKPCESVPTPFLGDVRNAVGLWALANESPKARSRAIEAGRLYVAEVQSYIKQRTVDPPASTASPFAAMPAAEEQDWFGVFSTIATELTRLRRAFELAHRLPSSDDVP
jgi:hypothetical protein